MNPHHHEKYIMLATVFGFTAQLFTYTMAIIIYPPVYSGDIPIYEPKSNVVIALGLAIFIFGCTVMGIKLADDRKVLPAAGFTMLAITMGVWMASLFEITQDGTMETFEKSYYIVSAGNFLYLPAMVLIAAYDGFHKWVRYLGLCSSIPFIVATLLFLNDYKIFTVLDEINLFGYFLMVITQVMWAVNVYQNYKKKKMVAIHVGQP
jgi:hypothetical protein